MIELARGHDSIPAVVVFPEVANLFGKRNSIERERGPFLEVAMVSSVTSNGESRF
jgi:hypothetical protein